MIEAVDVAPPWRGPYTLHDTPALREQACAVPGRALAMIQDGQVIAAGGVIEAFPGCGVAWFMPSVDMRPRQYVHALRRCRAILEELSGSFFRIAATVRPGDDGARRWALRLGFRIEGYLRKATVTREDAIMMARVN
jgi:hypothetical protein